jgi:hypothetical protein
MYRKLTNKFNFNVEELVPLPSGGRLYANVTEDPDILGGFIKLRAMTIKEEEILSTNRFLKTGSTTRMIMERCIVSDIDAKDLLLFDANFLLFYLRKLSYGDEYKFKLNCQSSTCGKEFDHKIKISELTFEELPEDVVEPIQVTLPRSKFTVVSILPRLLHSEELYKQRSNKKKSTEDEDSNTTDNLLVTTLGIYDDNGEMIDKRDWREFYESLPAIDRAELSVKTKFNSGLDELHGVTCPFCESKFEGSVPVGLEFFRL